MGMGHDNDQGNHCASHGMFESLIKQAIDNLGVRLVDGVDAMRKQNEATVKALGKNADALEKVLSNQAERREWCGKQCSRIDNLEKSDDYQWAEIRDLRKKVYMGVGVVLAAQVVVVPIMVTIVKKVWP
jgi:hypothetical protein